MLVYYLKRVHTLFLFSDFSKLKEVEKLQQIRQLCLNLCLLSCKESMSHLQRLLLLLPHISVTAVQTRNVLAFLQKNMAQVLPENEQLPEFLNEMINSYLDPS